MFINHIEFKIEKVFFPNDTDNKPYTNALSCVPAVLLSEHCANICIHTY